MKSKKSFHIVLVILVVACVFVLNIAVGVFTQRYKLEADLTSAQIYSISDKTAQALTSLKKQVDINMLAKEETFVSTSAYNAQANEILKQFDGVSQKVTLHYIDYVKNPGFAANYPDVSMKHGDILVVSGDNHSLVKTEDLFNYATGQGGLAIASSKAEEAVLSAVLSATSDKKPLVSVVTGHGEYTMQSFEELLKRNNYELTYENLLVGGISSEAAFVVLIAPKTDLSPEELKKLDSFLENGGLYGKTLYYFADISQPTLPNIETFLAEWGLRIHLGSVFETDETKVYNYQPFYAVAEYVDYTYADMLLTQNKPLLMPLCRPISALFTSKVDYTTKVLTQFSKTSGIRPDDADENFTAEMATQRGPFSAWMISTHSVRSGEEIKKSNVVLSGSTAMLDTYAMDNASFANAQYLINLFNDLAGREDVIQVTPKTITGNSLNLTQSTVDIIGSVFVFVLPPALLVLGLIVWLRRRHT